MIAVIEDVLRWRVVAPIVELRDVSFGYGAGRLALENVSFAVGEGEFVAIAGPNGGGKTTLLRLVLGLERPSIGWARLFGDPADRCRRRAEIGYVPQRTRLASGGLLGPLRRADRDLVVRAVSRVGLADRVRSPLRTLSGGMQQRAFIAKALAAQPSLLVLDEPTTGVDAEAQESLAALLAELNRELGVTILYVSHEFGAVEQFVERLVLVRGAIVFDGSPDELPGIWHDPSHQHA